MSSVSFRKLEKSYGALRIVKGIDLEIADREFVVLVGPSGCGKSTTLRMLAGLESISDGEIRIGDKVVNRLPPRERDIAMVFQDYALYPHKTVYENMAFSLKVRGVPAADIQPRIAQAAEMLGISQLLDRKPSQLSGGQRQRVAMGRAIVRRPQVFLFDEPLSNLDAKLRGQVRTEIKRLHQAIGTTIIYVTHDQVEARDVVVGIRPEHFLPSGEGQPLTGRVQVVEPLGSDTLIHFALGSSTLTARVAPEMRPSPGETLSIGVDPSRIHLFDAATERALV